MCGRIIALKHLHNLVMRPGIIMKKLFIGLSLIFTFSFIFLLVPQSVIASENPNFWIEYIDVGQGDSALIQCDGHYMMIDGGPSNASSTIYSILRNKGIRNIDVMIATHPDADHIGGLSGALNYSKVGKCYSPVKNHDTKTFKSLVKYLGKQGISLTVPKTGERFRLGRAIVQILGPNDFSAGTNNESIVTKVTYEDNSFLFMGDAEDEEERILLASNFDISADVIKIGHHGSSNSTDLSFIKKVNPVFAIISVGENPYGHPTDETLNKLTSSSIKVFRTDLLGDIVCSSDGINISFSTEKVYKAGGGK